MTAAELVASKKHILLDFDGPICAAFAGYGAANISRQLATLMAMEGADVPAYLFDSRDPFEVLRYAATLGDLDLLVDVDAEFRRLEMQAVRVASPTPGAIETIRILASGCHTVTIVSNNSTAAIQTYVQWHQLDRVVAGVNARTGSDPSLLKPSPHLLLKALQARTADPSTCVMVGDSASDIDAAKSAGVSVIALANKQHKRAALADRIPNFIISDVRDLVAKN